MKNKAIIVQKFGGTCLANKSSRLMAVKKVMEALNNNHSVVVVVSAMGRQGAPYATDTLLEVLPGTSISKQNTDLLLSCGEIISAVLLASLLEQSGCSAIALTGAQAGILTDKNFGNANICSVKPKKILRELKKGKVVVVAGFQGSTPEGDITTLGRGGSDITAAALGAALSATKIEIFTDVPGVMSEDPKDNPIAYLLPKLSYDELDIMVQNGAKVTHSKAIDFAKHKEIPLWIGSLNDAEPGTVIIRDEKFIRECEHYLTGNKASGGNR